MPAWCSRSSTRQTSLYSRWWFVAIDSGWCRNFLLGGRCCSTSILWRKSSRSFKNWFVWNIKAYWRSYRDRKREFVGCNRIQTFRTLYLMPEMGHNLGCFFRGINHISRDEVVMDQHIPFLEPNKKVRLGSIWWSIGHPIPQNKTTPKILKWPHHYKPYCRQKQM